MALEGDWTPAQTRYAEYLPFTAKMASVLDQRHCPVFPNPHSFTGEDVVELQGHGGPVVMDMLIRRILHHQRRPPSASLEFSERAFLNDKWT